MEGVSEPRVGNLPMVRSRSSCSASPSERGWRMRVNDEDLPQHCAPSQVHGCLATLDFLGRNDHTSPGYSQELGFAKEAWSWLASPSSPLLRPMSCCIPKDSTDHQASLTGWERDLPCWR